MDAADSGNFLRNRRDSGIEGGLERAGMCKEPRHKALVGRSPSTAAEVRLPRHSEAGDSYYPRGCCSYPDSDGDLWDRRFVDFCSGFGNCCNYRYPAITITVTIKSLTEKRRRTKRQSVHLCKISPSPVDGSSHGAPFCVQLHQHVLEVGFW